MYLKVGLAKPQVEVGLTGYCCEGKINSHKPLPRGQRWRIHSVKGGRARPWAEMGLDGGPRRGGGSPSLEANKPIRLKCEKACSHP